jgi:predicted amidohydrolase YtcJ
MLIRDAEIYGRNERADVRIVAGRIDGIGRLMPQPGEPVLDATGGALLPGLHDHHLHLMSYAAALGSVRCGPPEVTDAAALAAALARADAVDPRGWIRGIGYHESVAGDIDRAWLDRHGPDRPVRVQHRSGRLWMLNSAALAALAAADPSADLPLDGLLYDRDTLLRALPDAGLPPVATASRQLAAYGVTGVTDMTPSNDAAAVAVFRELRREGSLLQRLRVAGTLELSRSDRDGVATGETKIHLHEAALPPFDALVHRMRRSHEQDRAVAVHCVTRTELVFTLAALRDAGVRAGDRIEHASVAPPEPLEQIRALGLIVVTQPNFVAERGDAYLLDVAVEDRPWLYRCHGFLDAGIPLAAGTDAAFGHADPWAAMQAAVTRETVGGHVIGAAEALTPEQALALFLGTPELPHQSRAIEVGGAADLCLLDAPWSAARTRLSNARVRATLIGGTLVWSRGKDAGEVSMSSTDGRRS